MNNYLLRDMEKGMTESFEVTITEEMMDAFERISGDSNPLHTEEDFPRERGFQGRVVYGALVNSFYSSLIGVYLPGRNCLFHEIKAVFKKPVYIGDRLTITGTVEDIREATGRVKIRGEISNQKGEAVNQAMIMAGFTEPRKP